MVKVFCVAYDFGHSISIYNRDRLWQYLGWYVIPTLVLIVVTLNFN